MKQPSRRVSPNQCALWSRFELVAWQARAPYVRARARTGAYILNVSGQAGAEAARNPRGTKRPVRRVEAALSLGRTTLLARLALPWLEC